MRILCAITLITIDGREAVRHDRCASKYIRIWRQLNILILKKDYSQGGGERQGPVITVETIDSILTQLPPNVTFVSALQSYLNTITIGSQLLFIVYDAVLPESIEYHTTW